MVETPAETGIQIIETPGRLPPFWDRSAVFVANLLGLFFGNESETQSLADEVGEVDSYGGRLIPIIDLLFQGKENLLVLERAPEADLCGYFQETLGLSLPDIEILPHRDYQEIGRNLHAGETIPHSLAALLTDHAAGWVDGYVTDATLAALADQLGKKTITTQKGSRLGNNKRLLHEFLEAAGLPVVMTEIAISHGDLEPCLARLEKAGFSSGVIKAPIGASGIGMLKVDSLTERARYAAEVPEHYFFEGPCLVQGWLKPGEFGVREIYSPSVQLFLDDESVSLYDMTEQILSGDSIHQGNEAPPPYLPMKKGLRTELLRQAGVAGHWLHQQGYRGTASADFLVVDYEDRLEVYVCELNARVTGATYPSMLARHFIPDGAWLLRNIRFAEPMPGGKLLEMIEKTGNLYRPGASAGILPVNFNFGKDELVHKGQFLCLANSSAGSHVLLGLAEFGLPCELDRD